MVAGNEKRTSESPTDHCSDEELECDRVGRVVEVRITVRSEEHARSDDGDSPDEQHRDDEPSPSEQPEREDKIEVHLEHKRPRDEQQW